MTDRWIPTRAGLIGIWRYDEETFTFHRGRLLLRGPNGSGKSMALELLLPFLLDGDSSPGRLTSSGRTRGRLLDRLLPGTTEASRVGFAWVEFRHRDQVFTVGARIRGSRSTNKTDLAMFTTTQAIGRDLHLLDQTRTPLSAAALKTAIGDAGAVHETAERHRAAVREVLFGGFSAERYASVITALLALRREKLSDSLDPEKLSGVLTDALPPLDDQDIAAVAEGFERLDRRRTELLALDRDLQEMKTLAAQQRTYARTVIAAAADLVRKAETTRDDVTKNERLAQQELSTSQQRSTEVSGAVEHAERRIGQIDVEIEAVKDTPAYREGAGLADLQTQADRLTRTATIRQEAVHEHQSRLADARTEEAEAAGRLQDAADNLQHADEALVSTADELGAAHIVHGAREEADPEASSAIVTAWIGTQTALIHQVRELLDEHRTAVIRRDLLDDQVAVHEQRLDSCESELAARRAGEQSARHSFAGAIDDWIGQCTAVGADRLRRILGNRVDEPDRLTAGIAELRAALAGDEAAGRQRLDAEHRDVQQQRADLHTELERWRSHTTVAPPAPPWRSPRDDGAGAPLWRLVDVSEVLTEEAVDGLEAALTGSGLIDAWVSADGALHLPADAADVHLVAATATGRTLREVLIPAPDTEVPVDVIERVLASIAIADTIPADLADPAAGEAVAFGLDGSYRLGAAFGRGARQPAELLGAAARERHRRFRIADLEQQLTGVDRELARVDRELAALDLQAEAMRGELAAAPSGRDVADAVRTTADAESQLAAAGATLTAARDARTAADDEVRSALRRFTSLASQHRLPADADGLNRVRSLLDKLREANQVWLRRAGEQLAASRGIQRASRASQRAVDDVERAQRDAHTAELDAQEVVDRLRTIRDAIGREYDDLVAQLAALTAERAILREQLTALREEDRELIGRVAALEERVQTAEARRREAEADRDAAHRGFVGRVSALRQDADFEPELPLDTSTAVLAAARAVPTAYDRTDISERAIQAQSSRVNDGVHQVRSALGARVDLDREQTDGGWWNLRATMAGVRRSVSETAGSLAAQLEQGRAELVAEEEKLFEQTLAGSVRRALADRIRQANALVDNINGQLAEIKTAAAGVGVRLRWEVDPDQPAEVRAARTLLLRDPAGLNESERGLLQDFVRARVEQARQEVEINAPWEERMRESLDYRSWHRFSLQVAHRDWDGYQPATPKRLQKLSTGERSMALHLPMIAAMAAHYAAEDGTPSSCPRLILLDELFAGVDEANRGQLFSAFTTWQLDAVFTSDHEWCTYRGFDGIAIHHLHAAQNGEPVTSTRFVWDGISREIDPEAA